MMKFGSYEYPMTNITHPGPNDILLGRGGGTNSHSGNVKFRKLVATHKLRYLAATKADKPSVARDVVKEWRSMDPPGRFLAKVDGSSSAEDDHTTNYDNNSSGGIDDSDRGGNNIAVWYDVGEKKAREKASQCLRERNGVTNEAVAALVKTITASGEECPQDYETLMTKAALIKAQNDITLQHQHQHQQYQRGGSGGGGVGVGVGHGQEIDWGDDTGGGEEGGVGGVNNYRNQYSSSPAHSGSGSTPSNEDDLIEAEIQRLLKLRQQQIRNSQQKQQQQQQQQLHRQRLSPSTSSGEPQAYMGEESVLREYEQLMQKQRELNLIQSKISSMGMGMNAMNFNVGSSSGGMMMNSMGCGMGKAGGMGGIMGGGTSNNGVQPNAAQEYMNRLRMLRQTSGRIAGVGNNNDMDQMMSSANLWNNMNMVNSSNMDLGSGGMMGGGNNSNNMNSMQMLRQFQNNNMGGGGGGGGSGQGIGGGGGYDNSNTRAGQDEFTIEEYQASLQNFLSHGGGHNNKKQMRSLDVVGLDSSHRTNLDASHRTAVAGNLSEGLQMQVPTNFDYGVSNSSSGANKRNRRRSILRGSVDDSDLPNRNTFASMMDDDKLSQSDRTSCTLNGRNTMNSIDDLGMRNTFKSVDTMDLMSIGNSINDIAEEDWEQMTPDMRARYSRRLSLTMMSGVNTPFQNQQWGSGRFGTGRPKMSNSGDNMEQYLQVQTKDCNGPRQASKATRNSQPTIDFNKSEASQLSLMLNMEGTEDDSRLSFMSNMSELTDFQDILSKQADEARR